MPEPWRIYLEGLHLDAEAARAAGWARDEVVRQRAHAAYQATADALTAQGWDAEDALLLTQGFGQDVKSWLDQPAPTWDDLRQRLEARWSAWQARDAV